MSTGGGIAVDVKVEETLRLEVPLPDGVQVVAITLESKSGQMARLRVRASESVRISRSSKRQPEPTAG